MPGDIIDILERLSKADNIPHNQLYYIAENCADHYYSKVIETFVALLKQQFADRQLLLINTARSLKILEEYADRQVLIWQIFRKHQNIPDDISNLHLHIDNFKVNIQKEFNFLKEVTCKNVENFQTSLNLQQTYSVTLGSHINNIYHKISEIQQLPHPTQHMNTGNVIQIDTLDFNPDIDGGLPTKGHEETQGSDSFIQHFLGESEKSKAPALLQQVAEEVDWPDAVPVEIPPQLDQDNHHNIRVSPTPHETNFSEIRQLESDIDEEEEGQFEDLQTYLTHHNTYQESQNIRKEYRKRLLDLADERYYRDIDCMYQTYGQTRDHIPVNETPRPHRTIQEGRGRGQAHREELYGHQPFGALHDPYRVGFKERSEKLNACDRDMQIPKKTLSFL